MSLIMRDKWAAYMYCSLAATPGYNLIGEGFTDLSESKNAQEYSRHYVHERTERTDVTGYASSISYSADVYDDDPVVQEVIAISDQELVGSSAQRDVVSVNLFKQVSANVYEARKRPYAVIPDSKGDGTDALIYSGNMKAVGDAVAGTFNTSTKTFNATVAGSIAFTSSAGTSSGKTSLSDITPTLTAGNSYVYKITNSQPTLPNSGDILDHTWTAWDGSSEITAANGSFISLAEIDANSACVKVGSAAVVSA